MPNGQQPTVPRGNEDHADIAKSQEGEAPSDQELIDRARRGHAGSFGELIQRHYKPCMQKATSILRNAHDAEDEVQNACWKAFMRLPQFRETGTFAAWLCRIVENQCLMRLRENRKASFTHLDNAAEPHVRVELVGEMRNPEDDLGEREVGRLVRKEISLIPSIMRDAMVLCDLKGLPVTDAAHSLGLSVPATKSRLSRARAELRARMAKHCGQRGHGTLTRRSNYRALAFASRN